MKVLRTLATISVAAVALLSSSALACTCLGSVGDLLPELLRAFDAADHVLIARVVADSGDADTALLEVLEVFKGTLKAGKRIRVEAGGGSMCLYRFFQDQDWLIYSSGPTVSVRLCSRSRVLRGADVELAWLRTRTPPPVPVALQRGRATCVACRLDHAAAALSGTTTSVDLEVGLASGRPFHVTATSSGGAERAVGRAGDGQLFEVLEVQDYPFEACGARLVRRWCAGLSSKSSCVRPGPEEVVCDEAAARQVHWEARESAVGVECRWREPARPVCALPPRSAVDAGVRADAGVPAGPTLRCLHRLDDTDGFACRVE